MVRIFHLLIMRHVQLPKPLYSLSFLLWTKVDHVNGSKAELLAFFNLKYLRFLNVFLDFSESLHDGFIKPGSSGLRCGHCSTDFQDKSGRELIILIFDSVPYYKI